MEGSEESPLRRVPLVDRVSARTRGSRPVGPPPPSNLFDVPQPPSADGGGAGTLHHAGGDLLAGCPQIPQTEAIDGTTRPSGAGQHGVRAELRTAAETSAAAAAAGAEQLARNTRPLTRLAARNAAGAGALPAVAAGSDGDGLISGNMPLGGWRDVPPRDQQQTVMQHAAQFSNSRSCAQPVGLRRMTAHGLIHG